MSTEITVAQSQAVALPEANSLMQIIANAASDPNVDVTKMQALLNMQVSIMERTAKMAYDRAMITMQPHLPIITRNAKIEVNGQNRGRYCKLDQIEKVVRPILHEHGFVMTYSCKPQEKSVVMVGKMSHREGHTEISEMQLPHDTSGSKNAVQGVGSSQEYGRRYLLVHMANIVMQDEDTDGNSLAPISAEQARQFARELEEVGADMMRVLDHFKIERLNDLPQQSVAQLRNLIDVKRRKMR
jgi:hypothetical protein